MMKEAICKYGAISTAVFIDQKFMLYVGGPYSGFPYGDIIPITGYPGKIGVVIIGWDDSIQCWLIKNSWGTGWGSECGYGTERGYMWIKYGTSKIGMYSTWVQAAVKPGL
jgi:cathepsin L